MQMTDEVRAALATLKTAAENDFERLAIERLETALTNPPRVEVVDETHQRFNGITFKKDAKGHYRVNFSIHQSVWQYFFGSIPKDHVIHHVDEDKGNNAIENLKLMSNVEHAALHACKNQPYSYRQNASGICEWCGKSFDLKNTGRNRFCSHSCANAYSLVNGNEPKTCEWCGKEFRPRRKGQKCCCRSCTSKLVWKNWREKEGKS